MRHLTEGFDFLGFNIRHDPAPLRSRSGDKRLMKPSQGSIQPIRRTRKALWRQYVGSPTVALINTRGARRDRGGFLDQERPATLRKFAWTRMVRHRLVPKTYSPDDLTLQDYWRQPWSRPQAWADRLRQLAYRQKGRCPVCLQVLENGEDLHVHHVLPKQHGGMDDLAPLCLVHANGHLQLHSTSAPLGGRRWREPYPR
jgi:RNA-directed DNA polymerase